MENKSGKTFILHTVALHVGVMLASIGLNPFIICFNIRAPNPETNTLYAFIAFICGLHLNVIFRDFFSYQKQIVAVGSASFTYSCSFLINSLIVTEFIKETSAFIYGFGLSAIFAQMTMYLEFFLYDDNHKNIKKVVLCSMFGIMCLGNTINYGFKLLIFKDSISLNNCRAKTCTSGFFNQTNWSSIEVHEELYSSNVLLSIVNIIMAVVAVFILYHGANGLSHKISIPLSFQGFIRHAKKWISFEDIVLSFVGFPMLSFTGFLFSFHSNLYFFNNCNVLLLDALYAHVIRNFSIFVICFIHSFFPMFIGTRNAIYYSFALILVSISQEIFHSIFDSSGILISQILYGAAPVANFITMLCYFCEFSRHCESLLISLSISMFAYGYILGTLAYVKICSNTLLCITFLLGLFCQAFFYFMVRHFHKIEQPHDPNNIPLNNLSKDDSRSERVKSTFKDQILDDEPYHIV